MAEDNKHIINKVFVEVNTSSKERAYYFKDNLDTFINQFVLPGLMKCFDDLGEKNPGHFLQVERLDVELGLKQDQKLKGLQEDIVKQVEKEIHKLQSQSTHAIDNQNSIQLIQNQERQFNKLFHFLQKGTSTWWSLSKEVTDSDEIFGNKEMLEMFEDEKFIAKLPTILRQPLSRKRFILQFRDEQIQQVFDEIVKMKVESEKALLKTVSVEKIIRQGFPESKGFDQKERVLIWDMVLNDVLGIEGQKDNKNIQNLARQLTQLLHKTTECRNIKEAEYIKNYFLEKLKTTSLLDILEHIKAERKQVIKILEDYRNDINQSINEQIEVAENSLDTNETGKDLAIDEKEASQLKNELVKKIREQEKLSDIEKLLTSSEDLLYMSKEETEDLYINNAGLILVHPFLGQLFKNCKVLNEKNEFTDKEKAVHILHFVATGKEQQFESQMVLEKFLCELPIKYPINRFVKLEDEEKKHVEEMLTALVGHWQVMKNSSNDLLRNEFLQRQGKLVLTEDRPKVILERKTQDILLDKIPWNISMIKLPWKDKIIFADW